MRHEDACQGATKEEAAGLASYSISYSDVEEIPETSSDEDETSSLSGVPAWLSRAVVRPRPSPEQAGAATCLHSKDSPWQTPDLREDVLAMDRPRMARQDAGGPLCSILVPPTMKAESPEDGGGKKAKKPRRERAQPIVVRAHKQQQPHHNNTTAQAGRRARRRSLRGGCRAQDAAGSLPGRAKRCISALHDSFFVTRESRGDSRQSDPDGFGVIALQDLSKVGLEPESEARSKQFR